ncbi:hypothetical protein [Pseudoalteromonas sp. BDTF-M6]|uniref:hypothetical protein n=1 Tax=Pseudoalteromonas sp. BDTF-M6 TaxID=2796132 RepID=UPI001BB04D2E|nr:hypothetical protein [Pseudoalteromonas sp. BDTF-M6]MBS3799097.1 hypothetical protein [Pseudoalteromonas sp. BDTF-M6]
MKIKVPTLEEFLSHDGLHYKNLWREVGDSWICPSCKRSKYEVMRWAKRFPNSSNAFWGWVAPLHRHHDHSAPYMSNQGRFPMTAICDQCNSSDGAAKRKLRLPKDFSFSPQEIGCFVNATPHGKHEIDYEMAKAIYDSLHI